MKLLYRRFFLFLFFLFSLSLLSCSTDSSLPEMFSSYDLSITDLSSATFYEYSSLTEKITINERYVASKNQSIRFIDEQSKLFYSIFEPQRVSYPGPTTKNIICPEEFLPLKTIVDQDSYMVYYVGFANANYIWGACSKDSVVYESLHLFLYCENKQSLFVVDYFVPYNRTSELNKFVEGISCE